MARASLKFIMDSSDEDASGGPMNKTSLGSVPDPAHQDPSRSASTSHANDPSQHRHPVPDDDDDDEDDDGGDDYYRRHHHHHHHHHHHRDDSHNNSLRAAPATIPATSLGNRPRPSPSPSSTSSPAIPPPSPSHTGTPSTRPAPPGRRQSTASIESMDHNSAYGRGASSSSANMPMRPMSGPREDHQVKLTPITGRVSRAKKGVPVHVCEDCNPRKTFTRAEHLRRHRLSHGTPQFPCMHPGCDKAFHRADLLARHSQRHNESDDQGSPGPSDMRGPTYGSGNPAPLGPSPMGDGPGAQASLPSTQPGVGSSYSPAGYVPTGRQMPSGDGQQPLHQHPHSNQNQPSPQGGDNRNNRQAFVESTYILPQTSSPVVGGNYGVAPAVPPRTTDNFPYLSDGLNLMIPDVPGLLPAHDNSSPWPSSEASESAFSTPPSEGGQRGPPVAGPNGSAANRHLMPGGYTSPASDWNPNLMSPYTPVTSHGIQSPGTIAMATPFFHNHFSSPVSHASNGFAHQHLVDMSIGQPLEEHIIEHPFPLVRSLTPATVSVSAQPAESLVAVSAASAHHAASPSLLSRHKSPVAISVGPLAGASCIAPMGTIPRAARLAIPHYIDMYWKHFDPLFPLVHRSTFETTGDDVLRCAMAAIATQFLPGREARARGAELHEFASREVRCRHQLHGLETLQTIVLCEFYARFRGRKVANKPSTLFQRIYSTVLGQQSIYDRDSFLAIRENCWKDWVQAEAHRRFLACCFTLDVHASMYHEHVLVNSCSTPTSNVPLQGATEGLWEAKTPEDWESELARFDPNQPLTLADETLITPERINSASALDRAVMLASEVLRLPRREKPAVLDLSAPVDLYATSQITTLFHGNPVACTYSALHYTPLHDLLAVSGDSWVFTQKIRSSQKYHEHQRSFKAWCSSQHLGAAVANAAKALLAFVDPAPNTDTYDSVFPDFAGSMTRDGAHDGTTKNRGLEMLQGAQGLGIFGVDVLGQDEVVVEEDGICGSPSWNMSYISDYWAMHVCALILWAFGQRPVPGKGLPASVAAPPTPSSASPQTYNTRRDYHNNTESMNIPIHEEDTDSEALQWLGTISKLRPEEISNLGDCQKESLLVVAMIRRRLESEATAGHRSRLLVDSLGVLKNLERGTNPRRP